MDSRSAEVGINQQDLETSLSHRNSQVGGGDTFTLLRARAGDDINAFSGVGREQQISAQCAIAFSGRRKGGVVDDQALVIVIVGLAEADDGSQDRQSQRLSSLLGGSDCIVQVFN